MNKKGGMNWAVLIMAPAAILIIVAIFPVLNILLEVAFSTIDSSANVYYGSIIKLLLGSAGLVLGLGVLVTIINNLDTRSSDQPQNF